MQLSFSHFKISFGLAEKSISQVSIHFFFALLTPFFKMNTMQYRNNHSEERILRSGKVNRGGNGYQDDYSSYHRGNNQTQQFSNSEIQHHRPPPQKKTKRAVSETKKKYVASRQKWRCGNCSQMLEATFEVDHKVELQNGGTNHVDNLWALCPNCHREKGIMNKIQQ